MPSEIDNDLPAYLEFLILAAVSRMKKVNPDHILVKAVEDVLDDVKQDNPDQLALFRDQAL